MTPSRPTDSRVTLRGHIQVPDDRLQAIRDALGLHIQLTRAEAGCLTFDVTESTTVPGRFDVFEVFADPDAFRAHQARTAASDWGQISAGIPRDYAVTGLPE